jgi:hypothetical protein
MEAVIRAEVQTSVRPNLAKGDDEEDSEGEDAEEPRARVGTIMVTTRWMTRTRRTRSSRMMVTLPARHADITQATSHHRAPGELRHRLIVIAIVVFVGSIVLYFPAP